MQPYIRVITFVIPFSFLLGVWWNFYRFEQENQKVQYTNGQINVLSQEGLFSQRLIQQFERAYKIKVTLKEYKSKLNHLNEILAQHQKYDVIQVSSLQASSMLKDQIFADLDKSKIANYSNISADFLHLDYDLNNQYFAPITWGVNGFLYNSEKVTQPPTSFKEVLSTKEFSGKISLINSCVEYYSIMNRHSLLSDEWIKTENLEKLSEAIKAFSTPLYTKEKPSLNLLFNETLWFSQTSNGEAARELQKNPQFKFWIPQDQATLWLNTIGIPKKSKKVSLAYQFINFLLSESAGFAFSQDSKQANVIHPLNSSALATPLKASFLRTIDISRLNLTSKHEGFQSIWKKAMSQSLPQLFPQAPNTNSIKSNK